MPPDPTPEALRDRQGPGGSPAGPGAPTRDATEAPLLSLRSLRLSRGSREVVHDLSLEVERGEIFGILGPNGAGKTSLFRALLGLLPLRSGSLVFEGRTICGGDRKFLSRCGVVFQDPALDPRLSLRRNLTLAAALYGLSRDEAARRGGELLDRMGLGGRAGEAVATLSGGLRRRVELARALIHRPALLILDEPSTGLDEGAFRALWSDLLEMRDRRGLTLLLTTHRPDEAEYCDRLAILEGGRLVACDTPDGLRRRVRGDLLVLETQDPDEVARILAHRFEVRPRRVRERLLIPRERGHEWIPRLVEALPAGLLRSISLRRAGLGEVFLELTGRELQEELTVGSEDRTE